MTAALSTMPAVLSPLPGALPRAERVLEAVITLGHLTGLDHGSGEYLSMVAEAICTALDFGVCVIYLYDRFDDTFYAEATYGIDPEERGEVLATPVPARVVERLCADPFRLDRGYYVPATAPVWYDPEVAACFTMSASPTPLRPTGWETGDIYLLPLQTDAQTPVGFVIVDEPAGGQRPDADALRGLAALATCCANAVESARLYQLQNEEASISSVLLQVSKAAGTPDQELLFSRTATILATLLGADHCVVWNVEGDAALRPVAAAPDGVALEDVEDAGGDLGALLARGEPVVVEQQGNEGAAALASRMGLTSALLIPLVLHEALVGAITVGWTGLPHRFRVRELDIARGVSRLVGVALQNARLYRDVTRQAERNAELYAREREAVQRLQDLDQLRSDFVTTISHELRTPLTSIKGFTETLLSYWERLDDGRRMDMVRKVGASSGRLERLVQDLLFISRIESGVLPLRGTVVELAPLVDLAVQEVEGKYRGQEIQVRAAEAPARVVADPDRVQQVLVNLLDNAAKYSPEGRPIRIRWSCHEGEARLAVVDRGPGIAPDAFGRLFTRFGKLDHTPRPGYGGTGLGLYISKSLVEAMGGRITVRSKRARGSIFTITLPLAPPA